MPSEVSMYTDIIHLNTVPKTFACTGLPVSFLFVLWKLFMLNNTA